MTDARPPLPAWWAACVVLAACGAVASAVWLLPASVSIVQWPASGPVRLALLSPTWQLAAWWAFGLVAALVVVQRRLLVGTVAPFALLWLWVVPFLPWLPDRMPLLLVLAGPIRWVIVLCAFGIAGRDALARALASVPERAGRRAVLAISLALYLGLGLWSTSRLGVGGDEPHYLIITESLIRDGDLKIENNHRQRDYRRFFSGDLRPDFFERGKNGEIYSIHAPGLPALAVPSYLIGGRAGVVAFIALLAALAAVAVFDLAEQIAGRRAAWGTWLAVCLTVPFLPYAWLIFPEMPGALLVAWGALWLFQPADRAVARWLLRGTALAALPWLHTKFIVFLATFAAGFGLKLLRDPRRLVALATPIAVSTMAWLYSFHAIYGSFDPEAPYGDYSRIYVLMRYIPHGLIGIFFDQKFGLLFYSPVYLAAIAGAWWLLRRTDTRPLGAVVLLAAGAFVVSTARLYMFWGGSSAPARFLVPVLPCLAPMLAVALQRTRGVGGRALLHVALGISVALAAIGVVMPERLMLFSDPHGRARVLEWLQAGSPLALVVPTFTEPGWAHELGGLVWWLGVVVGAAAATARVVGQTRSAWGSGVLFGVLLLIGGAVVTATPETSVRVATARRGALDTLQRFDGNRFRTLRYDTLGRATLDDVLALTTVPLDVVPSSARQSAVTLPVVLPAGSYDAVIHFAESQPRSGELLIGDSPRAVFGRRSGSLDNPTRVPFVTPMATRRLTVSAPDVAVARNVTAVEIVPRAVVPPPLREPRPVRTIEALNGVGFIGYTDERAYPEGGVFWTRGTARTEVLVAKAAASSMTLTLSTGPNSGSVFLTVDGQMQRVDLRGGEERTLTFPLSGDTRLVSVAVQSGVMFRPADVDPRAADTRGLGCQVRIALE